MTDIACHDVHKVTAVARSNNRRSHSWLNLAVMQKSPFRQQEEECEIVLHCRAGSEERLRRYAEAIQRVNDEMDAEAVPHQEAAE